jgi:hypothetical protein
MKKVSGTLGFADNTFLAQGVGFQTPFLCTPDRFCLENTLFLTWPSSVWPSEMTESGRNPSQSVTSAHRASLRQFTLVMLWSPDRAPSPPTRPPRDRSGFKPDAPGRESPRRARVCRPRTQSARRLAYPCWRKSDTNPKRERRNRPRCARVFRPRMQSARRRHGNREFRKTVSKNGWRPRASHAKEATSPRGQELVKKWGLAPVKPEAWKSSRRGGVCLHKWIALR